MEQLNEQTVKGTGIIPVVSYIKEHYGPESLQKILEALPPNIREHYTRRIMEIKWYPLETLSLLYQNTAQIFHNGDPKICWAIGRSTADYGLNVIYKFFLKLGTPTVFVQKGPDMWKTYYGGSTLNVLENRKGYIKVILEGLRTNEAHMHSIGGWMERAGELTGGKNIKISMDIAKQTFEFDYE
jgi:hypothetical protein